MGAGAGDYAHYLAVAVSAAREAGSIIAAAFDKPPSQLQNKFNFCDLVTETDQQCEKLVLERLQQAFPQHKFIGEETTAAEGSSELTDEPTWMCELITHAAPSPTCRASALALAWVFSLICVTFTVLR